MTGLVQRACMRAGIDFSGFQAFLNGYHGLIQRIGAAVVFVPVGVVAHLLRRRTRIRPAYHAACPQMAG
jgi:hypothetical protein